MAEENKNDQKPVPPGWNDPPPISPATTRLRTVNKLNQRVAYPLSTPNNDKPKTPLANIPPMGSPPTCSLPPPSCGPPTPKITTSNEETLEEELEGPERLDELKKYVEKLAGTYGRDKTAEICHRFEIMAGMWPKMEKNTKTYAYEVLKSLHEKDIDNAKNFHEKLVQECGLEVVHWILMIKILINHISSS